MRVRVMSLALLAAIVALPVPASQMLAGPFPAPSPVVRLVPGDGNLRFLLRDPFLIDDLSFAWPNAFSGERRPEISPKAP